MKLKTAEVLKRLMKAKGVSVRECARSTAIPQSTLNALVTGREPNKPQHLLTLAQYFQCSVEFLLTGQDSRPPSIEETLTKELFDGWIKIRVERAIPGKRKIQIEED